MLCSAPPTKLARWFSASCGGESGSAVCTTSVQPEVDRQLEGFERAALAVEADEIEPGSPVGSATPE